jgi:dihydrodipicolinate synthase/N-acetylneuraminate lyase
MSSIAPAPSADRTASWAKLLRAGTVIPAHPLALTPALRLDERSQRALTRYYCAAGVGGVAVGAHTTQFEIHDPKTGLLEPVLTLAAETVGAHLAATPRPFVKIAGLIGRTEQALREAELACSLGYHAGLLGLSAFQGEADAVLLDHCRAVAQVIPVIGFYLQPAVGGRILSYRFWRAFAEIENVVAIKIAPFNRYQTLDVIRAVVDAGCGDKIALYTGNDDNIVADLIVDYVLAPGANAARIVGGLLGQWAVWTKRSVEMLAEIQRQRSLAELQPGSQAAQRNGAAPYAFDYAHWLTYNAQLTDANAALFDVVHQFQGSIAGLHYVLHRQGLMQGVYALNPRERLSPGQVEEIERVRAAYPHLTDDDFVAAHRDEWLH